MWQSLIADNPILIKHIRARLRRQHLFPLLAVVVIISALITWAGFPSVSLDTSADDLLQARMVAFICLLILQGLLLLLGGAAAVAGSIAQARESGMMDFHRISPQRPISLALGFLLGGPIREYLLFAATLPFAAGLLIPGLAHTTANSSDSISIAIQHDPLHALGYLKVLLVLLVLGLLYHTFALLYALVVPKTRGIAAVVVITIFLLHIFVLVPGIQCLTIMPTLLSSMRLPMMSDDASSFFFLGGHASPFLISLLHQAIFLIFLFAAAVRKLRNERAYICTKSIAVWFFAALALLTFGDVIDFTSNHSSEYFMNGEPFIVLFCLLSIGLLLATAITPTAGDIIKGVRHRSKLGLSRVPAWSDLSINWAPMLAMSAILLLVGVSILCVINSIQASASPENVLCASLIAALALLFYGLSKQYFALRYKKNAMTYLALMLFFLWLLPLLLGLVCAIFTHDSEVDFYRVILGISPLGGIGTLIDNGNISAGYVSLFVVSVLTISAIVLYIVAARRATAKEVKIPVKE